MNLQNFRLVQGRLLLFGRLLKSQYKLLPFGALCNLVAKMHNLSKFWKIKSMNANFFYYSIYDRFIQFMIDLYKGSHVHACVRLEIFSLKDWIFTKFHRKVP